jgi:hypothetical protein
MAVTGQFSVAADRYPARAPADFVPYFTGESWDDDGW